MGGDLGGGKSGGTGKNTEATTQRNPKRPMGIDTLSLQLPENKNNAMTALQQLLTQPGNGPQAPIMGNAESGMQQSKDKAQAMMTSPEKMLQSISQPMPPQAAPKGK